MTVSANDLFRKNENRDILEKLLYRYFNNIMQLPRTELYQRPNSQRPNSQQPNSQQPNLQWPNSQQPFARLGYNNGQFSANLDFGPFLKYLMDGPYKRDWHPVGEP